jgi:hypothetical protein
MTPLATGPARVEGEDAMYTRAAATFLLRWARPGVGRDKAATGPYRSSNRTSAVSRRWYITAVTCLSNW